MLNRLQRGEFFYGWIIVGVTSLISIGSTAVSSAPGLMIIPMQGENGWALSTISAALSAGLLVYGLSAPFSGAFIDRFGPRKLVLTGLVLLIISLLASARMNQEWQLVLFWGVLCGFSTGLIGTVLGAAVASRWFVAKRGLVTGIFGAAGSAAQLIFVPLLIRLVLSVGWRSSIYLLAGVMAALIIPVFLLLRDDPADVGLLPY